MDDNLLKAEDLEGLLSEIKIPMDSPINMTDEMKASQRRDEEYIIKNMDDVSGR